MNKVSYPSSHPSSYPTLFFLFKVDIYKTNTDTVPPDCSKPFAQYSPEAIFLEMACLVIVGIHKHCISVFLSLAPSQRKQRVQEHSSFLTFLGTISASPVGMWSTSPIVRNLDQSQFCPNILCLLVGSH